MKSTYLINKDRGLTTDELQRAIPASYSNSARETCSPRYQHIPTYKIIEALGTIGYLPYSARQAGNRNGNGMEQHAKHIVTFKNSSTYNSIDGISPVIYILNSSNKASAYRMGVGLFRAQCLNNFICSLAENYSEFVTRHVLNISIEDVISQAKKLASSFPLLLDTVEQFKKVELSEIEKLNFAEAVLSLRYSKPEDRPYSSNRLLQVRRFSDKGHTLWDTLNVLQENITQTTYGRWNGEKTTRKVGLVKDMALNAGIWSLAQSYLPSKAMVNVG